MGFWAGVLVGVVVGMVFGFFFAGLAAAGEKKYPGEKDFED